MMHTSFLLSLTFMLVFHLRICFSLFINATTLEQQHFASQAAQGSLDRSCQVKTFRRTYRHSFRYCDPIVVTVTGCAGECESEARPTFMERGMTSRFHPHLSTKCKCCVPVSQEQTFFLVRCPRSPGPKIRRVNYDRVSRCECQRCGV